MTNSETAESKVVVYFGLNQIEREISPDEPCYIFHSGGFFLDNLSITQNGYTREYSTPNVANITTFLIFIAMSILFLFVWSFIFVMSLR
ncbi:MAG: hypothetical protein PHX18_04320 [Candidatus Gastranaerophilales bacterium]|nr:hypothetical protein [Candidatus Gastranaerophilales bacterium]